MNGGVGINRAGGNFLYSSIPMDGFKASFQNKKKMKNSISHFT